MNRASLLLALAASAISATALHAQDFVNQLQPRQAYDGSYVGSSMTAGALTTYRGTNGAHGIAVHAGHLTVYQGHSSDGQRYSGTAVQAGHLTAYQGHGPDGQRYSGTAIQSGPATFYQGNGVSGPYSGMSMQAGPLTTYNGRSGSDRISGMGITAGNTTNFTARVETPYSETAPRTYRGTGQRVGNMTIYRSR